MFGLRQKRQYTDIQLAFLEALKDPDNAGDLKKCKEIAGYKGALSDILRTLSEEITNIAREMMAVNAARAVHHIIKGMDDPDPLTPVRTQNAERILDRVGLGKGEKIQVETGPSRIAILPARRTDAS